MIIHIRHVRAAKLCAWGIRQWCRRNGVDMRQLTHAGIPLEQFAHLQHDPFAARVIAAARLEEATPHA